MPEKNFGSSRSRRRIVLLLPDLLSLDFCTFCSLPTTGTACLRAVSTKMCLHYGLNISCLPSYKT